MRDTDLRIDELLAAVRTLRAENERLRALKIIREDAERLRLGEEAGRKRAGKPTVMRFGRYRGAPVEDLPLGYVEWLLGALRKDTLENGRFAHRNGELGAALMERTLKGDLDGAVKDAVAGHRAVNRTFDAAAFLRWVCRSRRRKLHVLWLGVAYCDWLRREGARGRCPDRKGDA
jgi:hypothetical protein